MENQYHLVSVKPEQLHLPAREDRMAVGPPLSKKLTRLLYQPVVAFVEKKRFCFAAKS